MKKILSLAVVLLMVCFVFTQLPASASGEQEIVSNPLLAMAEPDTTASARASYAIGDVFEEPLSHVDYRIESLDHPYCPWANSGASCLCKYLQGSVIIDNYEQYSNSDWKYQVGRFLDPYKLDLAQLKTEADWDALGSLFSEYSGFGGFGAGYLAKDVEFYDSEYDNPANNNGSKYKLRYKLVNGSSTHWDNVDVGFAENDVEMYMEHYISTYKNGEKVTAKSSEFQNPTRNDPCKPTKSNRNCNMDTWYMDDVAPLGPGEAIAISHAVWEKDNGKPPGYDSEYPEDLDTFMDSMLELGTNYVDPSQAIGLKTAYWGMKELADGKGYDDRLSTVTNKFTYGALRRLNEHFGEPAMNPGQNLLYIYRFSSRVDAGAVSPENYASACAYDTVWSENTAGANIRKYYMDLYIAFGSQKV